MERTPTVLFLCPHAAAKSLIAATYCRAEAARRGVRLAVESGGTEPDDAPAPAVVAALAAEGFDVAGHRPSRATAAQLARAAYVVSLGCDGELLAPYAAKVERWDDVPPPSQGIAAASAAIRARLTALLDRIERDLNQNGGQR